MPQHETLALDPRTLGRRLQEARKARGLTQQEAAEALSIARTTVTAIEKGDRRARAEELVRLAEIYGRRVNELVGPREPLPDFAVQFRAATAGIGAAREQQDVSEAIRDFQLLCEDYRELERLNDITVHHAYPNQYPVPGMSPDLAAQDIATAERNRLALGDGPLLQFRALLDQDVGLRVFSIALPSRIAGLFAYTDELGGCVAVNAKHPLERRRWTLAHEYGHFLTSRYHSEVAILGAYERRRWTAHGG